MSMLCPVCGDSQTRMFLHREQVPVHQNLRLKGRANARATRRGDLDMVVCEQCGFVFNAAFDPELLAYGKDYENTQSHSAYFTDYMQGLADRLVHDLGVRNSRIVEVGCGKGRFLRMLVEPEEYGNFGVGFDPSYVGPDDDADGRLRFERRFYDASAVDVQADVVVCRHVIEHIESPLELLRNVYEALAGRPDARVYFETPCVEWILRNEVLWDVFYEHCSLFTVASLRTVFERSGFVVDSVEHVFGGQYLWLRARPALEPVQVSTESGDIPMLADRYRQAEQRLREVWQGRIVSLADVGRVAIWGAGAKGTTFANLIDPEAELIDSLIDINPTKQGHHVPGSGHPIVGLEAIAERSITHAVLMNPNYRQENLAMLSEAGLDVELVE